MCLVMTVAFSGLATLTLVPGASNSIEYICTCACLAFTHAERYIIITKCSNLDPSCPTRANGRQWQEYIWERNSADYDFPLVWIMQKKKGLEADQYYYSLLPKVFKYSAPGPMFMIKCLKTVPSQQWGPLRDTFIALLNSEKSDIMYSVNRGLQKGAAVSAYKVFLDDRSWNEQT